MQIDSSTFYLIAVPLGCGILSGWQFVRAHGYRQRLAEAEAQHRYERSKYEHETLQSIRAEQGERLLLETGTDSIEEMVRKWQQLNYRLGYALHHIEDFKAPVLLKKQLVTIASRLRVRAKENSTYQPVTFYRKSPPIGGFREMAESDENEVEREVWLLIDGLNNWQLAGICCYIMDGYYLEGAFYKVGISVYSPTGEAMALGKKDLNRYGAKVNNDYRLSDLRDKK